MCEPVKSLLVEYKDAVDHFLMSNSAEALIALIVFTVVVGICLVKGFKHTKILVFSWGLCSAYFFWVYLIESSLMC